MELLELPPILSQSRTRVIFGPGRLADLGRCAKAEGATYVLLVTDRGIEAAGHVSRALDSLKSAGLAVTLFDDVQENPTTVQVDAAAAVAEEAARQGKPIDLIVGLGGGSAMDCAKGVNFIQTNGGKMSDYWGIGKATKPMLPMIAVPTTAGTGSEAQSFALISDPVTHQKMACGDIKAACRLAILDPDLTATVPPKVAAATGIDAVAHAVETAGTAKRNEVSLEFTRQAWVRITAGFERAVSNGGGDADARALMLLGAHLAGAAIEHSMLGAAHACANPLTARCGITHGVAVGVMLPHVVRFNCRNGHNPYDAIDADPRRLAARIDAFLVAAKLPARLSVCSVRHGGAAAASEAPPARSIRKTAETIGVPESLLPQLAHEAATQWTAGFNPVRVTADDLLSIYRAAL